MKRSRVLGVLAAAGLLLAAGPAWAEEVVKVGFINTMTGPWAKLGGDMLDGFNLAVKLGGGRLGGARVEMVVGDDQLKPDVARGLVERMGDVDKVDLFVGVSNSNVMAGMLRAIEDRRAILLSPNTAMADQAGKSCRAGFFAMRDQNDGAHEAAGAYAAAKGYKRMFLIAPNYVTGKDGLAAFKRAYKGEVLGEIYTPLTQLDFKAELAKIREAKPDAVYFFYPGGLAIRFLWQFEEAGMIGAMKLLGPSYSLDATVLPATSEAAIGAMAAVVWTDTLDNPANTTFVNAFQDEYHRKPSPYAAVAYDTAHLIAAALTKTGGKAGDRVALQKALAGATFESVRGEFRLGPNHFPIQNYYMVEVVRQVDGEAGWEMRGEVFHAHGDSYAGACAMKPYSTDG